MSLVVGSVVPDFTLPSDDGGNFDSSTISGSLLVYFYPKDDTPGCTREAKAFSEKLAFFTKLNITVLGVSKDHVRSHKNFKAKYKLKVKLLSDSNCDLAEKLGATKERSLFGKNYTSITRCTLLIDRSRVLVKAWRDVVNINTHVDEVSKIAEILFGS